MVLWSILGVSCSHRCSSENMILQQHKHGADVQLVIYYDTHGILFDISTNMSTLFCHDHYPDLYILTQPIADDFVVLGYDGTRKSRWGQGNH